MKPISHYRSVSGRLPWVLSLATLVAVLSAGLWATLNREAVAQVATKVPTGAEIVGNTWCSNVSVEKSRDLERQVAALLDLGGQVVGYFYSPQFTIYTAMVCGKLTK